MICSHLFQVSSIYLQDENAWDTLGCFWAFHCESPWGPYISTNQIQLTIGIASNAPKPESSHAVKVGPSLEFWGPSSFVGKIQWSSCLINAKRTAKTENPFVSDSKIPARAAQNTSGIKVCIHQTPVVQWQILEINSQNELLHTLSPEHTKELVVSFLLQATLCYRGSSCEECKKDPKRTSVHQKVSQHSWSHDLTTGLLRTLGSSHISAFDFFVTSFLPFSLYQESM